MVDDPSVVMRSESWSKHRRMLKNFANPRLITLPNAWWVRSCYKGVVHMCSAGLSITVTSTLVSTCHTNGAWGSVDDVQYVKTAPGRRHAKIKMHIVQALLGLRYERLIYTAFVKLCHKHENNAWDAPHWTPSTNIPSFLLLQTKRRLLQFSGCPSCSRLVLVAERCWT